MDIYGVDYMLFIIALMAIYLLRDWKKALILFLYYVVGHSITLALAVNEIVNIDIKIVEYLVPLTIFIAASLNILKKYDMYSSRSFFRPAIAFIFGIIHGFGFADYHKEILGTNQNIAVPVIGFNVGLELGMFLVGSVFLIISWIFVNNLGISRRDWNLVISSGIAGIALTLMFESRYWL